MPKSKDDMDMGSSHHSSYLLSTVASATMASGSSASSASDSSSATSTGATGFAVAQAQSKYLMAHSEMAMKYKPMSMDWDPEYSKNVESGCPPESCLLRVKRDIIIFHNDPPPGVFMEPDETDFTVIHSLITGPIETPYEGGFFYFIFRFPNNYPITPPMVKLLTTGDSRVRFNPNLYRNGKVCLSLLRTWSGPDWSPCLTLSNLLLSIQSLMSEKPYHNEPGFEREAKPGDAERYNAIVQHETLRVAVCDMLEGYGRAGAICPDSLKEVMEKTFHEFYDYYESTAKANLHLDGTQMQDPFGDKRGKFVYSSILERLRALKVKLDNKRKVAEEISSDSDTDTL